MQAEALLAIPEKAFSFGYVLGVIYGDGSVSRTTDRRLLRDRETRSAYTSYRIRLQVTDRAFAEAFRAQWRCLTGRYVSVWSTVRTNFDNSSLKGHARRPTELFIVSPRANTLGRYFHYRKYECAPEWLLSLPREAALGFICGFIDSEGYVNPRYLDIANQDEHLLESVRSMFSRIGYPTRIYRNPSQRVAHLRLRW